MASHHSASNARTRSNSPSPGPRRNPSPHTPERRAPVESRAHNAHDTYTDWTSDTIRANWTSSSDRSHNWNFAGNTTESESSSGSSQRSSPSFGHVSHPPPAPRRTRPPNFHLRASPQTPEAMARRSIHMTGLLSAEEHRDEERTNSNIPDITNMPPPTSRPVARRLSFGLSSTTQDQTSPQAERNTNSAHTIHPNNPDVTNMARPTLRPLARRLSFGVSSTTHNQTPLPGTQAERSTNSAHGSQTNTRALTPVGQFEQAAAERAAPLRGQREASMNGNANSNTSAQHLTPNQTLHDTSTQPTTSPTTAFPPYPPAPPTARPQAVHSFNDMLVPPYGEETPPTSNPPINPRAALDHYTNEHYLSRARAEQRYQAGRRPNPSLSRLPFPNTGLAQVRSDALLDDPEFVEFVASARFMSGRAGAPPKSRWDTRGVLEYARRPVERGEESGDGDGAGGRQRLASVSTLARSPAQQLRRPTVSEMSEEGGKEGEGTKED